MDVVDEEMVEVESVPDPISIPVTESDPDPPSPPVPVSIERTLSTLPFTLFLFRIRRGWSQPKLGRILGSPRTYVSRIEQGWTTPSIDTMFKLAKAFGVEVGEIWLVAEELAGVKRERV